MTKNWTTYKLADICDIKIGRTPSRSNIDYWGQGHIWVSISDMKKKYLLESKEQITDLAVKEARCPLVKKGTLLMSFKLSIGKLAFAETDLYTNEAIAALPIKPKKEVYPEYLYYALKFIPLVGSNSAAKGQTMNSKSLADIEIPFPPNYLTQIYIANLLAKTEQLITKRLVLINLLDDFVKNVFTYFFGNLNKNPKGFDITTIGDLAIDVKYGTSKPANGGSYKYLRMNNITFQGYWDLKDLKFIDIEDNEREKYLIKKGDLVFNRTNSKELVGKTAVVSFSEEMVIAGYLIRLRFKENVNPWFIWGHLNSKHGKSLLFNLCRNIVGMANINAKEIQAIPILNPPTNLQNKYALVVEKTEVLRNKYLLSLTELQNFHKSLMQRLFRGNFKIKKDDDLSLETIKKEKEMEQNKLEKQELVSIGERQEGKLTIEDILVNIDTIIENEFSGVSFSFDDIMAAIENRAVFVEYDKVKDEVFKLLEKKFIKQIFDESKEKQQIVFELNK